MNKGNLYTEFDISPIEARMLKLEKIATNKKLHSAMADHFGIERRTIKRTLKMDLEAIKRLIAIEKYIMENCDD